MGRGLEECDRLQWCCFVQVINRNNSNTLRCVCKNLFVIVQKKQQNVILITFKILNFEYS